MPRKKHNNPSQKTSLTIHTAPTKAVPVTEDNPFTYLQSDIETKERVVDIQSKKELHEKMDRIWKLLISDRGNVVLYYINYGLQF